MNNRIFKVLSISSFLIVQYILATSLATISDGFIESISLSLSDSSKMMDSFLFILLVATKNIIIVSLIMDDFYRKLTIENTYKIIRYRNKKEYGKNVIYKLIKNIAIVNTFTILIILAINIGYFKNFIFEINLLKVILGNFLYLTFKYLFLTLITAILSFYISRNISLILVSITYIIFTLFKNSENLKLYSPLNYLDFHRSIYIVQEEIIRFIIVLFVCIYLIILFLRTIDNHDIIYFRRGHE